jgi:PHD/YefM family antitoxin component YafN of YafNO toxin-antitoxin module
VDENGAPKEVIIPFETFKWIEETLGLDLDQKTVSQLAEARRDRERGTPEAYVDLDSI